MSATDRLLHANDSYAATFSDALPAQPKLHTSVVACMDARLDLFGALGLQVGDAHLIRNAGGLPTDDVLRSLAVSQRRLGTREVVLLHHTGCGMQNFDDVAFRAELEADSGTAPPWDVPGFIEVRAAMRQSLEVVRSCGWLPHRDRVRGFVLDVTTARLEEVA